MNDRLIKRPTEERGLPFDFCFLLCLPFPHYRRPVTIVNIVKLTNYYPVPETAAINSLSFRPLRLLSRSPLSLSQPLLICNANFLFYELAQPLANKLFIFQSNRVEAYSCKMVASDKRLYKTMHAEPGTSPNDLQALSLPQSLTSQSPNCLMVSR